MDGRTRNTLTGNQFPIVFGERDAEWPFYRASGTRTEPCGKRPRKLTRYAESLAEHARRLEQMRSEAEQYARSLEGEVTRLRGAPSPATSS